MERPFADFFLEYLEYHIYLHKRLKQVAAHFGGSRSASVPFIFKWSSDKKNSQDFWAIKGHCLYVSE